MKKSGKLSLFLVFSLVLSLGLAASVYAQHKDNVRSHPNSYEVTLNGERMNVNPEEMNKLLELMHNENHEAYLDLFASLRKQKMAKLEAELAALREAENPDGKAIQAKQKELNALNGRPAK